MKIYDITRTLQDAPVYPGDMPVVLQRNPAVVISAPSIRPTTAKPSATTSTSCMWRHGNTTVTTTPRP